MTMLKTTEELAALNIEHGEETTFGNYTINIIRDDDAESPRSWDNLGSMACWHNRYNLGDTEDGHGEFADSKSFWVELSGLEFEDPDYLTEEELERAQEAAHKKNIILPLYLYDHSGITMNTTGFGCGWDSGQVGYIYVSLERIRHDFGCKRVSKQKRKLVEGYLAGEVETYDQFLTGEIYGYTITHTDDDGDEEDMDSCWGFFGYNDQQIVNEIKSIIKHDMETRTIQLDLDLPLPPVPQMDMYPTFN